jgi:hypothetical protein
MEVRMVARSEDMAVERRTDQAQQKKPYRPPELTKYGALRKMTLGIQCPSSFPTCSPASGPF